MTKNLERKDLQYQLTAALNMGTPLFSKFERNVHPAARASNVVPESINNTNKRP